MPKIFVFASALLLGAAVFGSAGDPAWAAGAKSENAEKRAECARSGALHRRAEKLVDEAMHGRQCAAAEQSGSA